MSKDGVVSVSWGETAYLLQGFGGKSCQLLALFEEGQSFLTLLGFLFLCDETLLVPFLVLIIFARKPETGRTTLLVGRPHV